MTRLLARLSEISAGHRSKWVVIGAWVALALAAVPLQGKLQERAADESDTFLVRGAESTEAKRLIDARFRSGSEMAAVVAYFRDGGHHARGPRPDAGRCARAVPLRRDPQPRAHRHARPAWPAGTPTRST